MGKTDSGKQDVTTQHPASPGLLPADGPDLVNQLARELTQVRRELAAAKLRLGLTSRTLDGRTQDLMEARAALVLLLATLDSTTDGVLAVGYFGRAMHFNRRFIEMWQIAPDHLATLNDTALLTMQLTQVKDPQSLLSAVEKHKSFPDHAHFSIIEMIDGRALECQVLPQRVNGKRLGVVTTFRDVTDRERLGRLVSALEIEMPREVAEAKASTY